MTTIELPESLPSLNEQEAALVDLLTSPNPIWVPLPGPQTEGWLTEADELYYGGGAGGGKTDLEIGLAITAHRRSIIFRREYKQLRDIIDRSREIIGTQGQFNQQTNIWKIRGGRTLELGAVQFEQDVDGFQGRAHDLKEFDELPQFTERQYRFLIGWNRTTFLGQRCRVVGAGNPPTNTEGEWVIRRWAPWLDAQHSRPALPGELRWFAVIDGDDTEVEDSTPFTHKTEIIEPRSRTFIPARLSDNPYLERSGYRAILQAFPEPLRSQMLYGDFEAGTEDDPWQVIPTAWIRAAQARWTADDQPDGSMSAVGVDVARGGKDKTILARRYGRWFAPLERHEGTSTPDGPTVGGLVLAALTQGGVANIDGIGVGASVYDFCRQKGARVKSIIFSESATGKDRTKTLDFVNVRAEAYWSFREALDPKTGDNVALPPDPELLADLCAPHWSPRLHGIQIEMKEDIIKRIHRSPDAGDAVVLAAYTSSKAPNVQLIGEASPTRQIVQGRASAWR